MTLRIRIAPVSYGFGPVGKALHLARGLRGALGTDARLHLVVPPRFGTVAEPGLFDEIGPGGEYRGDLTIAVMNRAAASAAAARGEPVVFVDSLAWLWDRPLEIDGAIARYLYQDLPILPARRGNLEPFNTARPIGAVVGSQTISTTSARTTTTVLSLAGMENFEVGLERGNVTYPNAVLPRLAQIAGRLPGPVQVFGNHGVLSSFDAWSSAVTLGSGVQSDFLGESASARLVAVAPGLTTILELIQQTSPFVLLPPQNYSQTRLWSRFSAMGVPAVGWSSAITPWLAEAVLPEVVGSQILRALVLEAGVNSELFDPSALEAVLLGAGFQPDDVWVRTHLGTLQGTEEVVRESLELLP